MDKRLKSDTVKVLEGNTGRKISDIPHSNIYTILYLCSLCQILIDQRDLDLFLGSLFCSIDLCVCSYCQYQAVLITVAMKYSLISGMVIPPTLLFFLKIAAAIQGHLWFHINFWNVCSISVKYIIGILIGSTLNL